MYSLLCTSLFAQDGFGTYLRDVIQKQEKGILVAAKLIEACGLCDSLDLLMDYEYEKRYMTGSIPQTYQGNNGYTFYAPQHRHYGYTLFAETDNFWESVLGKNYKSITVENVSSYIRQHCQFSKSYRNDKNYSNPENVVYQFVTYHLLNRRLSPDQLVNHYNERGYNLNQKIPSIAIFEYYTTMGDRRLLRTYESRESEGIFLNRFPRLDNVRQGSYHEISCDAGKAGIRIDTGNATNIINAIIYPISSLLAFDRATAQNMGSIRLRMDVASFFPEMATNNVRLNNITDESHKNVYLPNDVYPYLEDLTINDSGTKFCYWTGRGNGWSNMQGDEFNCQGRQDFTLRLPPVPTQGTYELRLATHSGGNSRGIFQLYFGTAPDNLLPLGMPIDFRQSGDNTLHTSGGNVASNIGYQKDTFNDDSYNQIIDNELRENGYMKGCMQYLAGAPGTSTTLRDNNYCLRRILGKMTMDPNKTYYLRLKNVLDRNDTQFYLDYIEYCPKSVYDNTNEPEDIW